MSTTTRYFEHDGGRIAYDDTSGEGSLLLCSPGFGDSRATFRFIAPALAAAGYRVVTVDLRGAGESSADFGDYSTAAVASDLSALIRHLDAGPAVLLGSSYSAGAGVIAAADDPDVFNGLVLLGPWVRSPKANAVAKMATAVVGRSTALWMAYWGSMFPTRKPEDFKDVKAALTASMRQPGHMAALRAMLANGHDASEARLGKVACPVLVVMGGKDPDFKPDPAVEAAWIAERQPAEVAMIEGAGHYPQVDFPEQTAAAVLPFLTRVVRVA